MNAIAIHLYITTDAHQPQIDPHNCYFEFWLVFLNIWWFFLADIPYNGDSHKILEMVYVRYVQSKDDRNHFENFGRRDRIHHQTWNFSKEETKDSSRIQILKMRHQTDSKPRPSDRQSNAVPLSQEPQLPNQPQIFAIHAKTILMHTVASPNPNPRGGGQLPNPI